MRQCLLLSILLSCCSLFSKAEKSQRKTDEKFQQEQEWSAQVNDFLRKAKENPDAQPSLQKVQLDTLYKQKGIHLHFSEELAYRTLRKEDVDEIRSALRKAMHLSRQKKMTVKVDGLPLEQYVPLYFSEKKDKERRGKPYKGHMNVKNVSKTHSAKHGLNQRHIALWNSHGYYYNHDMKQWKWQRAPLFTTVEDLFTSAYVLPFLVPMLENAGANVYLPRERDIQTHELIIDNSDDAFSIEGNYIEYSEFGFKNGVKLNSSGLNPFRKGSLCELGKDACGIWSINVPESGDYAVYVSYARAKKSSDAARYEVHHTGGTSCFEVNQQMGGGTWVYLSTFFFDKNTKAKVVLNGSKKGTVIADAIRLGGGMGSIPRGGHTSGVPRWQEAARYYLQYSGAVDSLTFNLHGDTVDYNDDFRCRARWVNFLKGGENIERKLRKDAIIEGLNIPIDMAFTLHSDAGHFLSMDTTVGTLGIYSTYDTEKKRYFNSGTSRLSSRDLADLVQTQWVNDVRILHAPRWNKRELWDKMYSEATFAQVPSLLLEAHSHANAQDMRYGLDPQFRFDASRAMYKGVLRFLSSYYGKKYVVQPLPVSHFAMHKQGTKITLTWEATTDPLESTASPDAYIVYCRKGGKGWDNGTLVKGPSMEIDVQDTALYSYKVTAVNKGGESFPSATLSLQIRDNSRSTVLVVDGFTRVSAPFFIEHGDSVGVAPWLDEGVPWGYDLASIGRQYEYDQNKAWVSDEEAGHGASSFELADSVFIGNSFDNSHFHVSAIAAAGYNAVSASMEAVSHGNVCLSDYAAVDLLFGEQRSTVLPSGKVKYDIYTPTLMRTIQDYLKDKKARLLMSGAHIASDAADTLSLLSDEREDFTAQVLGFSYGGRLREGGVISAAGNDTLLFRYNTAYSASHYRVENADVLSPKSEAKTLFLHHKKQNAGVLYAPSYKVISLGFPFESIKEKKQRQAFMKQCLKFLLND